MRLIDSQGEQLGIKSLPDAMRIARDQDLDLVEVAPDANPPVCRIMDYGKFKFDNAQRARESRRKTTNTSIKEMKYRVKIGIGDFDTKTKQVARFLGEGHKVKITIMFRGRENDHPELGMKILDRVSEQVAEVAKVEAAPKRDGRNMIMVLAPDRRHPAPKPATKPEDSANPSPPDAVAPAQAETPIEATAGAPSPEPAAAPEPATATEQAAAQEAEPVVVPAARPALADASEPAPQES